MKSSKLLILFSFTIFLSVTAQLDSQIPPSNQRKPPTKKSETKSPKPLFPNLFLPPVDPFYGQRIPSEGERTPHGEELSNTHDHVHDEFLSPCPYTPQPPAQEQAYPLYYYPQNDQEGQNESPLPIPELFQKSTTTESSIFGKRRTTTEKSSTEGYSETDQQKPTTKKSPVFEKRRSTTPKSRTTTQPSSSEEEFSRRSTTKKPSRTNIQKTTTTTTTKPPKRIKTPQTTTIQPESSKSATKKPMELFPELNKNQRGGRKLDFKGLPEAPTNPLYAYPFYEPQQVTQPDTPPLNDVQQNTSPYLTPPSTKYKIAIVADLGKDAKVQDGRFQSFLKEGNIIVQKSSEDPSKYNVTIELDSTTEPYVIESKFNNNNEGFELSTLNVFDGKLYSCDDETGIIYELSKVPIEQPPSNNRLRKLRPGRMRRLNIRRPRNTTYIAKPWIILTNDDDGSGFRCEWATVKDDCLWVGSTGILVRKPENEAEFDRSRQIVKKVCTEGSVESLNWARNYERLSESVGLPFDKGFAVHEAVAWSDQLQRWVFTPRRISRIKQEQKLYHKKGGNTAVFVDNEFENFKTSQLGELVVTAGFTSIKFIPGTDDTLILALKAGLDTQTSELMSTLEVFDINGEEITPEISVGKGIYAGVEFI